MAQANKKELTALELMIEHADSMSSSVAGMPRNKRKSSKPDFSFDNLGETEDDDQEYYVGPGSRAKNKEARQRRAEKEKARQIDITVTQSPQPRAVNQQPPNPRQVESAIEELFIAGERSGEDIVHAIRDGNAVSAKTQKALEDWLRWEKSEAFKEKNKAKSDPLGQQPGAGGPRPVNDPANDDSNDDDNGGGLEDNGGDERRRRKKRGRRYGRGRGNRRGPGRRLPRGGGWKRMFKGKLGAALAIGAVAGAALYAGNKLKENSQEEFVEDNAENGGAGTPDQIQPKPVDQAPVNAAKPKTDEPEAKPAESKTKEPSEAQDLAVSGASLALMAASKRIPVVGAVLGNGLMAANDMQHIKADDTMTEAEKEKAYKTTAGGAVGGATGGSVGAIAGGWIGGILGSIIPGPGTIAGAALGATLGGMLGDAIGSKVGEYVADKVTDESDDMLAEGEKDRKEKMDEYNDTTAENQNKAKFPAPVMMPFALGGAAMPMMMPGGGGGTYGGPQRARPAQRLDSKQVTDIAQKAIAEGGLGAVSEQFESGGKGVGTVSTGRGDYGGVSYGKHQLATNNGSMMNFLNSKEGQPFLQRFGGLAPGTEQFNSVYKDVANTQGAELDKAQSDYITRTHYAPLVAKTQNDVGVDLSSRGAGVKELLYSTAVQYGSGTSVVSKALEGKDVNAMSDPELISAIQDYKAATTDKYFKSSDAQTQQSVAMRAKNEKDVLLKVADADQKKNSVNKTKTGDEELDAKIAAKFPDLPKGDGSLDKSNTSVDAQPVPDLTAKGPSLPKETPEQYAKHLQDLVPRSESTITPVQKPTETVEREPLVTEGDVARREAPEPAQVVQQAAAPAPSGGATSRPSSSNKAGQSPGSAHSLDSIPVFLDDPMLNMITMGYM
ncbi:hypothetical protein pEaSNUABM52_00134 [Erwinia phage pEp_SNUABM_52]|nr:hypothetical protein pEaSNUABM52_00134 [Erwinia phage pEp_SNUABM_52]